MTKAPPVLPRRTIRGASADLLSTAQTIFETMREAA